MIELIIFDFDGTLYDLRGLTRRVLTRLGLGLFTAGKERKLRHSMMGKFFGSGENFKREYFEKFARLCHTSPEKIQKWYYSKYMTTMVKVLEKNFSKRDGVDQLISRIKTSGKKAVVFSDYCMVKERCEAVGVKTEMFEGFYSAEELGGLKPAKEAFLKIAERFGVAPEKCLVIGDRADTDGEGARLAGMNFLLVKTHLTKPEDLNQAVEFEEIIDKI